MTLPFTVATGRASDSGPKPDDARHSTARGWRVARGLLLLAVSIGAWGCSGECAGPGCESSWPAARLAVVRGVPAERDVTLRAVAEGTWIGALEEGAGWTAAAAGDRVLVGQPEADRVALLEDRVDAGPVEPLATWSGTIGDAFGSVVVPLVAGDGSGDFDLWVGSPESEFASGAVVLFRDAWRDVERTVADADLVLVGGTAGDQLGASLVRCADLTGDRRPDLLVTAPWFASPPEGAFDVPALAGAVFFVRSQDVEALLADGSADPVRAPIWEVATTWYGSERGEGAGRSAACDRDLDGDGRIDLAIGAPWSSNGDGRVYLLTAAAPSGPLDEVADAIVEAVEPGEELGTSLATMEVGVEPMLAVGAPAWRAGAGRVHLFPGGQLGLDRPRPIATFEPEVDSFAGGHLGRFVYRADLDGDGRDDLLAGAPDDHGPDRNDFDTGALWGWLGAGSARWAIGQPADLSDLVVRGQQPFERVGRAVAVADLDGDGAEELLVPTRAADPEEER